jgi:hypothetical protein
MFVPMPNRHAMKTYGEVDVKLHASLTFISEDPVGKWVSSSHVEDTQCYEQKTFCP